MMISHAFHMCTMAATKEKKSYRREHAQTQMCIFENKHATEFCASRETQKGAKKNKRDGMTIYEEYNVVGDNDETSRSLFFAFVLIAFRYSFLLFSSAFDLDTSLLVSFANEGEREKRRMIVPF